MIGQAGGSFRLTLAMQTDGRFAPPLIAKALGAEERRPMESDDFVSLYQRRRQSFLAQFEEIDDDYIQGLLGRGLRQTDLCMTYYVDLGPALVDNMTKNRDLFTKTVANLETVTKQHEELQKQAESLKSDDPALHSTQISLEINRAVVNANISAATVASGLLKLSSLTSEHFEQSLIAILRREDDEAVLSALFKLVEFLVGLSGLGNVMSAAAAIKDILEKRTAGAREANSFLNGLRSYITATFFWCVAAQIFLDGLKDAPSESDGALENAINLVQQRLDQSSA